MSSTPETSRIDPAAERTFREALRTLSPRPGMLERILRIVFRAGFRLAAWHLEAQLRLPVDQPAGYLVVAAPHRAWLEPFLLFAAWPAQGPRLVWLADGRTVSRSWWRRRLLPRLGVMPISGRVGSPSGYASLASEIMARGLVLVVFPEVGPPSAPERTRRISPGFAYLALVTGGRMLPIVVAGSHHIVRGASFELRSLPVIEPGPMVKDVREPQVRARAHVLAQRYRAAIESELADATARTDARRPPRDRWRWLATLFD